MYGIFQGHGVFATPFDICVDVLKEEQPLSGSASVLDGSSRSEFVLTTPHMEVVEIGIAYIQELTERISLSPVCSCWSIYILLGATAVRLIFAPHTIQSLCSRNFCVNFPSGTLSGLRTKINLMSHRFFEMSLQASGLTMVCPFINSDIYLSQLQ